jgi:hypothetical protein
LLPQSGRQSGGNQAIDAQQQSLAYAADIRDSGALGPLNNRTVHKQ